MVLGEIVGVFGIKGEVRVLLHHREGETLFATRRVTLVSRAGERRSVDLVARPGAGKRVLGRVSGVDTPEAAAGLVGWSIVVDRAVLAPPAEGEFYVHDLLGMAVFDDAGVELGVLANVVVGERDVWVLDTPAGEAWVLASSENIRAVDLGARRVVVAAGALTTGD